MQSLNGTRPRTSRTRKHGISFEDAARVFGDPLMLLLSDGETDGEERWRAFGQVGGVAVIMVTHTYRNHDDQEKIRIISARMATRHEGRHMNEKTVSKKLKDLPPLTEADRERLAVLAARPDSEIDLSDMPELTEEDWKTAVRGKHYRPVKAQITAHLDKDVLAWLKADGRGYQTRMNAILRREMLQARSSDQ